MRRRFTHIYYCRGPSLDADNRDGGDGMFSIGQTLRIRVGPLKGYLCRVIAVRKRDVTVKLDSQQKVLTGLLVVLYLGPDEYLSVSTG